jgi:dienelactone hydrolase
LASCPIQIHERKLRRWVEVDDEWQRYFEKYLASSQFLIRGVSVMGLICRIIALMLFFHLGCAIAEDSLPSQKEYEPPNGKGRVVIVVSGQTGPGNYAYYAKDLAEKGYFAVLVDGNDFWIKGGGGEALLKGVIDRAQQSPHALPGKVAVIGFSLGGASTLTYASRMDDAVAAVVVSYPATNYITNPDTFVTKIKVPTLMFAGGKDTYKNCCLIETARKLADAAKASEGKAMLEVVEFPDADHGWTIKTLKSYRSDYTAEGFRRTLEHLHQYFGE